MPKLIYTQNSRTSNAKAYIDSLNNYLNEVKRDLVKEQQREIIKIYQTKINNFV